MKIYIKKLNFYIQLCGKYAFGDEEFLLHFTHIFTSIEKKEKNKKGNYKKKDDK